VTFAETLNQEECEVGVEGGAVWFADGTGNERAAVGDYRIGQTNSGVRVEQEPGGLAVEGIKDGKVHWAVYDRTNRIWKEING